ncbi:serine/threonine protein kinase [Colletotrichum plurivorum]|uniref:non-specific serine/threonine protein kinase n=1 Tax=Colletotrichum plurivorum TaxID=2175906 RepID=A0A8H6K5E7_9PEZI|nr:serine/threonine protein kinase [Colletotrichum plurivorum]
MDTISTKQTTSSAENAAPSAQDPIHSSELPDTSAKEVPPPSSQGLPAFAQEVTAVSSDDLATPALDSHGGGHTFPQDANGIEERRDVYRPGGFHPVYIGDIYNDRYEVLNKLGYGVYSTVWLVRDRQAQKGESREFLALKVLSAECYGRDKDVFEREVLIHLRDGDQKELGYRHVIGETLRTFGAWFPESMIPNRVMRRFTIQLLVVLDFAHKHNVIHTDIQPSNIFVKVRDHSRVESGYLAEVPIPQLNRFDEQYTPVPSRPLRKYYFNLTDSIDLFDIALGDWGVASWADKHLTDLIQPVALRAPEVLIGAPWDATVEMWNLGAIILELFRAVRMFSGAGPPRGDYQLKEHLAEIVHHFGPFPQSLLNKANPDIVRDIFDDEGRIKDPTPCAEEISDFMSEEWTPGLDHDAREEFVFFLRSMMKIDPAERPSAEDLLRGPWLRALRR